MRAMLPSLRLASLRRGTVLLLIPGLGAISCAVAGGLVPGLAGASPAYAQSPPPEASGPATVRAAGERMEEGDLEGAESLLFDVLESRPGSVSGLLLLERVLELRGAPDRLIEPAESFVAVEPGSSVGYHVLVRTLSALDRIDDLQSAADRWIGAQPDRESAYREIAFVWLERGDVERAFQVLDAGRRQLGDRTALALELGFVHARRDDVEAAVRELDVAVGDSARNLVILQRNLEQLPDDGAAVVPGLVAALAADPTSTERRQAAARLAVESGLAEPAERISRGLAADLGPADRSAFLSEIARRADSAGLLRLSYWAYDTLVEDDPDAAGLDALQVRRHLATLALEMGDTALARRNYRVLEQSGGAGPVERRRAAEFQVELAARAGEMDAALRGLEEYRENYPGTAEGDALAAMIAEVFAASGQWERALELIGDSDGPRARLVRGRIALSEGDIDSARAELLEAAPALEGAEATRVIGLVALLGRLSPDGGRAVAAALRHDASVSPDRAVSRLVEDAESLPPRERAAVLDFAASMAAREGLDGEAERLRRIIVEEHPGSAEAPAAMLAVGRAMASRAEQRLAARELLERMVVEYPRSPLVPQARRELERLNGSG